MPRQSRNVDARLLAAGRELYPETGAAGLSVRRLAERAGVNLGMFHYHFGSKDAFVRALLQSIYEAMFAELQIAVAAPGDAVVTLRSALLVIARFGREHRRLLRRLLIDAASGEAAAVEFLESNFPRHFAIVVGLVEAAQRAGTLQRIPLAQAIMFLAGAVAGPILIGSALAESTAAPPGFGARFESDVLSDAALVQRIDLALAGLSAPTMGAAA